MNIKHYLQDNIIYKTMKKKELILDENIWRCGELTEFESPTTSRGVDATMLVNDEGEMCCLGQFSLQLNKKLIVDDLLSHADPHDISKKIPLLNRKNNRWYNTNLSTKAIAINDDPNTTIIQKVKALRELFAKKGYKIRFKRRKK